MKKFSIAFLIVATVAIGAIFVLGQKAASGEKTKPERGFGKRFGGFDMFAKKLNLTDAQKAQVKQIFEESRTKVQPVMESLRQNRQKLEDLSDSGTFNEAEVQTLANEQASLTAILTVERERSKAQIFQILTPEQQAQAKQMKNRLKERFRDGFQAVDDKKNF